MESIRAPEQRSVSFCSSMPTISAIVLTRSKILQNFGKIYEIADKIFSVSFISESSTLYWKISLQDNPTASILFLTLDIRFYTNRDIVELKEYS